VFTPSLVRINLANCFNLTKEKLNKSIYSGNSPLVCMPNHMTKKVMANVFLGWLTIS
jgi:hypothetical protein